MMNPLLPNVLAVRLEDAPSPARRLVLDLHIPRGLAHFAGHFPGLPILPGVVQVDWAMRFAREHLAVTGEFAALENLKFLALVLPDARLQLALEHDPEKGQLAFAFSDGARRYSSGRVVFADADGTHGAGSAP